MFSSTAYDEILSLAMTLPIPTAKPRSVRKGYRPRLVAVLAQSLRHGPRGLFGDFLWHKNITDDARGAFLTQARRDGQLIGARATDETILLRLAGNYGKFGPVWGLLWDEYLKARLLAASG